MKWLEMSTENCTVQRTLDVVGTMLAQSRRQLGALVLATYFGGEAKT